MNAIEAKIQRLIKWGADPNAAIKRMLGDEELFFTLLDLFTKSPDWEMLNSLLDRGRFKEAFVIAHRMKGSAVDLSLNPLYESLCIITDDLRGEVSENLSDNVKTLMMIKQSLLNALISVE